MRAQNHQLIGSQIGRVRKKQFSVQCTGDPKTAATDSWLENENRSNRHTVGAFSVSAALLVVIISSVSFKLNLWMCHH